MIPEALVPWLAAGGLVIALLSLLIGLLLLVRMRRLSAVRGGSATPETISLAAELERIDRLGLELSAHAARLAELEAEGQRAMQRIGVVRYNPFEDTGSNQSFVLALLNARGDGFVLSSLHSRQQTRVFLKSVSGGQTETAVSDEEAEAIRIAAAG